MPFQKYTRLPSRPVFIRNQRRVMLTLVTSEARK